MDIGGLSGSPLSTVAAPIPFAGGIFDTGSAIPALPLPLAPLDAGVDVE